MGVIFAHNGKAYSRWRRAVDRRSGKQAGMSGQALESAVMQLAARNPEYVVMGA